jgi:hypothetical protein
MTMPTTLALSAAFLSAAFLSAACGKADDHVHGPGGDQDHPPAPAAGEAGHAHTERTPLGEVKLGEHAVQVFRLSAIEPGKESDFDLDFAAGKPLPGTVRGWIGIESGVGSMKVRFAKETATRMHGHPEVPKPLPDGSRLWLEVETPAGAQRASLPIQP